MTPTVDFKFGFSEDLDKMIAQLEQAKHLCSTDEGRTTFCNSYIEIQSKKHHARMKMDGDYRGIADVEQNRLHHMELLMHTPEGRAHLASKLIEHFSYEVEKKREYTIAKYDLSMQVDS